MIAFDSIDSKLNNSLTYIYIITERPLSLKKNEVVSLLFSKRLDSL